MVGASRKLGLVAVLLGLAGGGVRATAQIPTEYTNLQILPEDITRPEIVGIMRGYASALGVRCNFCHTVSASLQGPNDDFASDQKATKRKARVMMAMVERINSELLAELPDRGSPEVAVSCATCHGGIQRPISIQEEVLEVNRTDGVEAAVARYRELREQYFGRRAYDFGVPPLNGLGERLTAEGDYAAAIGVLEMAVELFPKSPQTLYTLAQAHERNEDPESALGVYRMILDLDPSVPFLEFYANQARRRVSALGGG
jgi:tetratricopeptide (TPR) repeat protein